MSLTWLHLSVRFQNMLLVSQTMQLILKTKRILFLPIHRRQLVAKGLKPMMATDLKENSLYLDGTVFRCRCIRK